MMSAHVTPQSRQRETAVVQLCWQASFRRQGTRTLPHMDLHARPAWTAAAGWSAGRCSGSFLHCQTADAPTRRSGSGVR